MGARAHLFHSKPSQKVTFELFSGPLSPWHHADETHVQLSQTMSIIIKKLLEGCHSLDHKVYSPSERFQVVHHHLLSYAIRNASRPTS